MNKRRRAYKKYDWQGHSLWLMQKQLEKEEVQRVVDAFDLAVLYGKEHVKFTYEAVTLKAGLWKITLDLPKAYVDVMRSPSREMRYRTLGHV